MKTKSQVEDTLSKEITRFYVTNIGTGPKETRVYVIHDMVIVRLKGRLLPIEEKILKAHQGIELVKNLRKTLHEVTVEGLQDIITSVTGCKVISAHSDVSTRTGERIEVYVLEDDLEGRLLKRL